jgi:hypothetical protein
MAQASGRVLREEELRALEEYASQIGRAPAQLTRAEVHDACRTMRVLGRLHWEDMFLLAQTAAIQGRYAQPSPRGTPSSGPRESIQQRYFALMGATGARGDLGVWSSARLSDPGSFSATAYTLLVTGTGSTRQGDRSTASLADRPVMYATLISSAGGKTISALGGFVLGVEPPNVVGTNERDTAFTIDVAGKSAEQLVREIRARYPDRGYTPGELLAATVVPEVDPGDRRATTIAMLHRNEAIIVGRAPTKEEASIIGTYVRVDDQGSLIGEEETEWLKDRARILGVPFLEIPWPRGIPCPPSSGKELTRASAPSSP